MNLRNLFLLAFAILISVSACKKEPIDPDPDPIPGCLDENSLNYNADATEDDGSCEYAEVALPLKAGNSWNLKDNITVPIIGAIEIDMWITVEKDTTIGEMEYQIVSQSITAGGFDAQEIRTAYRFEPNTGRTYSLQIDTTGREEGLFLDYPLDLGASWTASEPGSATTTATVFGLGLEDVPAGSFTHVWEVKINQTEPAEIEFSLFFARDVGYVKADFFYEAFGYEIWARPELVSYTLVE